jgi:hypothetical protein
VAHVGAAHDVDDLLGDVLGVVADALDGLGDPDDLQRGGDGARVFHHEGDELAQDAAELGVDQRILADDALGLVGIEARHGVEGPPQLRHGQVAGAAHLGLRAESAGRAARGSAWPCA